MEKPSNKILFWTPRIFVIVFALFLSIFSLDIFEMGLSLSGILVGLFMHNILSLVLLGVVAISWKYDLVGAIFFMILGIACIAGTVVALVKADGGDINPMLITGVFVSLLIGLFFLAGWANKRLL